MILVTKTSDQTRVCVCFLPIDSGHQVRWTYQPGSHRRKVTQDFSSTFFLRCVPYFYLYIVINLLYYVLKMFVLFLSGVPTAWRLIMQVYSISVGFSPILYYC